MNTNRAVSMISLVLTIVIILILAAITAPLLSNVMTDSTELDAKEEFANVVAVVQSAKKDILISRFVPNEDYLITDEELDSKFARLLTEEEVQKIKDDNKDPTIQAPFKYYLMNQERFDSEFGNDFNISRMRDARVYLVNYMNEMVLLNNDGKKMVQGNIEEVKQAVRGEVFVTFSPNGNATWAKQQSTTVTLVYDEAATEIISAKALWSESSSNPSDEEFESADAVGLETAYSLTGEPPRTQGIEIGGKTGNGWYLWVRVEFKDDGEIRTKYEKSGSFAIDNTPPTFELEVS